MRVAEEELFFHIETIEAMTRRSSLEVGFNHSKESISELRKRLQDISEYCMMILRKGDEIYSQGLERF